MVFEAAFRCCEGPLPDARVGHPLRSPVRPGLGLRGRCCCCVIGSVAITLCATSSSSPPPLSGWCQANALVLGEQSYTWFQVKKLPVEPASRIAARLFCRSLLFVLQVRCGVCACVCVCVCACAVLRVCVRECVSASVVHELHASASAAADPLGFLMRLAHNTAPHPPPIHPPFFTPPTACALKSAQFADSSVNPDIAVRGCRHPDLDAYELDPNRFKDDPMHWAEVMEQMAPAGVDSFVDPGDTDAGRLQAGLSAAAAAAGRGSGSGGGGGGAPLSGLQKAAWVQRVWRYLAFCFDGGLVLP
jgi:hypothetical protein